MTNETKIDLELLQELNHDLKQFVNMTEQLVKALEAPGMLTRELRERTNTMAECIEKLDQSAIDQPLGLIFVHLYSALKLRQDADGRLLIISVLVKMYARAPVKDMMSYKLIVGNLLLPLAVDQNMDISPLVSDRNKVDLQRYLTLMHEHTPVHETYPKAELLPNVVYVGLLMFQTQKRLDVRMEALKLVHTITRPPQMGDHDPHYKHDKSVIMAVSQMLPGVVARIGNVLVTDLVYDQDAQVISQSVIVITDAMCYCFHDNLYNSSKKAFVWLTNPPACRRIVTMCADLVQRLIVQLVANDSAIVRNSIVRLCSKIATQNTRSLMPLLKAAVDNVLNMDEGSTSSNLTTLVDGISSTVH